VEDEMKKILLCVDCMRWCFGNIAKKVQKHLSDEFDITVQTISDAWGEYDVVVGFWYGFMPMLSQRLRKGVGVLTVYDEYSWKRPGGAQQLQVAMRYADIVGAANENILGDMKQKTHVPVMLIEDGVDTDVFVPQPSPEQFTVGWTGNSRASGEVIGHPDADIKGLEIIRRACDLARVPLVSLDTGYCDPVPHDDMPEKFYRKISLYACASEAEGTPNPPLEAMACGRPVVTTPVGLMPKIINGCNGTICERTPESIAKAIIYWSKRKVLVSDNRHSILPWDWKHKVEGWRSLLRKACEL
jgi:hypothetical protein